MSKLRNKNIAEMFYHLGYIEKWGSGIQRSNQILLDNGFNELNIDVENIHGITVTINFDKKMESYANRPMTVNKGRIPTTDEVLTYYKGKDGIFTRRQIQEDFHLSDYYARIISEKLVNEKLVVRIGKGRATRYQIK